jgi:hypothetical protein
VKLLGRKENLRTFVLSLLASVLVGLAITVISGFIQTPITQPVESDRGVSKRKEAICD